MNVIPQNRNKRQDVANFSFLTLLILTLLMLLNTSCYYSCDKFSYMTYEAVYLQIDSLREAVEIQEPRDIAEPGALYYKDGYIFVNERSEGIHIIDNRNPSTPVPVSFISIPGNYSLAAKGNFMYTDSYTDLLVFDISDMNNIELKRREKDIFSDFSAVGITYDQANNFIVEYKEVPYEDTDCGVNSVFGGGARFSAQEVDVLMSSDGSGGGGNDTGEAGSMARFVVDGETLYAVDHYALNVFDVSAPDQPAKEGRVELGWGIETIFPYKDMLFIGAMDGMYIMDNTDRLSPNLLSTYSHTTSCDPVVVQDDYAYVTLRSGTECQGFTNQLDIVNISDPRNPTLEKTYQMLNPHGLDVNGSCLFICEGSHGLKAFNLDAADPTVITETHFYENVDAFDVISLPNILMMVGRDGFYQYQYNCGGELLYLSNIEFGE